LKERGGGKGHHFGGKEIHYQKTEYRGSIYRGGIQWTPIGTEKNLDFKMRGDKVTSLVHEGVYLEKKKTGCATKICGDVIRNPG